MKIRVSDHGVSALPLNGKRLQGAADARNRPASYSPLCEQADDPPRGGINAADAVSCNRLRNLILALVALVLSLAARAQARETLFVDQGTVIQDHFLGLNAVYHGFTYLPESLEMGMTDHLRAIEMARVKESGISIARTFYRPDWAMGDGPWLAPDWDSVRMQALYAWLADMQRLGVDVALNVGWWFPRDVIWNRDQHLASDPDDLQNYCRWLSESIHQIVQVRGFTNVKYLVMFTEPAGNFGDTPSGKEVWDYYKEVLRAAHQRLLTDGRRQLVKMVGPNTAEAPTWLDRAAAELNGVIDIYASHNYNFTSYREWYEMALSVQRAVAPTGKPFWIDEYGVQDFALRQRGGYGTILALANAAFLNVGAQSSFLWILNDQYYPPPLKYHTNSDSFLDGKHSWGLFPWLPESQAVRPGWDAFVLLSRLLGQAGGKVLQTKGLAELPIAAVAREGGGLDVLVVNGGEQRREVAVGFSSKAVPPLYRYAYRPQGAPLVHADEEAMPVQGAAGGLWDALSPGEVVIYSSRQPGPEGLGSPRGGARVAGIDNLAFRKTVEVSSLEPEWPAANLTDGKRLTPWRSAPGKKSQPEQVTIDLGLECQVRRLEIFAGYAGEGMAGSVLAEAIRASGSVDKKHWRRIPIPGQRLLAGAVLVASFPPRTIRYLRLDSQGAPRRATGRLFQTQLGEVKVFGH